MVPRHCKQWCIQVALVRDKWSDPSTPYIVLKWKLPLKITITTVGHCFDVFSAKLVSGIDWIHDRIISVFAAVMSGKRCIIWRAVIYSMHICDIFVPTVSCDDCVWCILYITLQKMKMLTSLNESNSEY